MTIQNSEINFNNLIQNEVCRLAEKYNKEYLDCADIMQITGLGRDNVRTMMARKDFPKICVGKRRIVSLASFVAWQISNEFGGQHGKEKV